MKAFRVSAVLLLLAGSVPCTGVAQTNVWSPGSTEMLQWPDFEAPIPVRVPDNYTPDRAWPIVFHYHTIGMAPNAIVPGMYSGNRNFITVGMTYREEQPEVFLQERDYWEKEYGALVAIRDHLLTRKLNLDADRVYVGGDGLGGWYASYFADTHGNDLAGVYMTGAGSFGASKIEPTAFRKRGKPVYVGAAQLELNFGYALNAKEHFWRLGGRVTFDEYTGQPHIVPLEQVYVSERLRQWFQVEGNRSTPETGRQLVAEWQGLLERKLEALTSPLDRFLFLDHLTSFPFYPALQPEFRNLLEASRGRLSKLPELKPEMDARMVYEQLLVAETKDFSIANRRNIAHHYATLYSRYPDTHFGKRAGVAVMRLRDQVENPDRIISASGPASP